MVLAVVAVWILMWKEMWDQIAKQILAEFFPLRNAFLLGVVDDGQLTEV